MGGLEIAGTLGVVLDIGDWAHHRRPDVDSAQELQRLAGELEREPAAAPAIVAWLRDHGVAEAG